MTYTADQFYRPIQRNSLRNSRTLRIDLSDMSTEAALLRVLMLDTALPGHQSPVALAGRDIDWNKFIQLADEHGALGLIANSIADLHEKGLVPDPVASEIGAKAIGIAAMSMRITAVIERIQAIAVSLDVPLMVLKGAVVGRILYDSPNARFSGDIDLLCKEEDYTRLHDAMTEAGFEAEDERRLPGKCSSLETAFEQHFKTSEDGIPIELHVDGIKLGVKPSNSDSIWERAIPVKVGNSTVLSLSYRDLALMLPIHLHRHGFTRLSWFKDIDLLITKHGDEIDWDLVIADAEAEGATSSLWLTLSLLEEMLGTDLPDGLVDRLKPSIFTRMGWQLIWPRKQVLALEAVTRRRVVQFSVTESWRGTIPSLLLMGRRREKLAILLHRVPWPMRRRAKAS